MPDIFSSVTASPTPTGSAGAEAPVVRLTFDSTSAGALKPYAGQNNIPLVVKQLLPGDLAVLALPNGQTITAQAPRTPLTLNAQLLLQVPANPAQLSANAALVLLARLAGAQAQAVGGQPQPVRTAAALPAGVTAPAAAAVPAPLPLVNLQNILRQTPLLQTVAAGQATAAGASPATVALLPTTLPAGPLVLGVASAMPGMPVQALPVGPAVVQITGLPAGLGQPQAALAYPIPSPNPQAQNASPGPVPLLVNAGQPLPVGVEIALTLPPATAATAVVQSPQLVQLGVQPPLPNVVASGTSSQAQAFTPPTLTQLNVALPVAALAGATAARVMGAATPAPGGTPQNPQFTQQLVLAGAGGLPQTATLTTPVPLPPGAVLALAPNPAAPTQLQVTALQLPQPPLAAAAPTSLPSGQPLTAVVTAVLPNHTLQLAVTNPATGQSPTVLASTPAPLPQGTVLSVRLNADGQLVVESLTPPATLAGQQALGRFQSQWPQLAHAAAQLQQSNPAGLQKLAEHLPQTGALLPGLASYLDALQHGNAQKWLGNEVFTMLRALGVDLTHDLSQLAVLRQPGPEGWQGVVFPYMETPQSDPQQGRFFWKNHSPEDEQQASGNTRFLVEMNLSQLGEVQLDGLMTYPELWLKLRLHPPADVSFGPELQNVVQTMLESFGLQGGLSVERVGSFPLQAARLVPAPATPTVAAEL